MHALIAAALLLAAAPAAGQVTTWQRPTPGCDAINTQTACCATTTLPAYLGRPFNFTMQALGAVPATISVVAGLPGTGVQGGQVEPTSPTSCCGFSDLVAGIGPITATSGNPAIRQVIWNLPSPNLITEDSIPTSYCITFRASQNGGNVACGGANGLKTVCPKICVEPVFVWAGKFMSIPDWGSQAINCGTDKGANGVACLRLAQNQVDNGKLTAYLQMSALPTLADPNDEFEVGVRVGQQVTFTIGVVNFDAASATEILVVADPGVPIGMVFGPPTTQCGNGNALCRTATWTPRNGQEGMVHEVKFLARNNAGSVCGYVYSKELTVLIPVTRPRAQWSDPTVDIEKSIAVGGQYDQKLSCRSNNYNGKVSFVNLTINGVLQAPGNHAGAVITEQGSTTTQSGSQMTWGFSHISAPGDAGSVKTWCFACGDDADVAAKLVRCLAIETRLCEYAVAEKDTLETLARRHHLNTNWLRMWNANPALKDPDLTLTKDILLDLIENSADDKVNAGSSVRIGGVYTIKNGDTINTIAARFETTVKKLLLVNPLLAALVEEDETSIQPGMDLCIMACTDKEPSMRAPTMMGWAS